MEVGVDEAGRGPLFGPVYAAAVVLPASASSDPLYTCIKDSKKLTPKKREELTGYIENVAITWGVGSATAAEIDEKNILQATFLAMHRALSAAYAKHPFDHILVDGTMFKPFPNPDPNADEGWIPFKCVVDGDIVHKHISAASILAKTYHDRAISKIVDENPDLEKYGLRKNKGYGTKVHMDALKEYGPSLFHRRSFRGVVV